MQKAISILLIFCVLMQSFSKLSIIASYTLNKEFISKVLCINKQEPDKGCEGKCYLTQQLAQAEKHDHLPTGNLKIKADNLFILQINNFRFKGLLAAISPASFYQLQGYPSPAISVFTPPKI